MKSIQKQSITIYVQTSKSEKNPDQQILPILWNQEWSPNAPNIFIDEDTFLRITWFKQKRLYLYLFRNKHIRQFIHKKSKLIELSPLLQYLWDTIQALENQKNTNKKTQ